MRRNTMARPAYPVVTVKDILIFWWINSDIRESGKVQRRYATLFRNLLCAVSFPEARLQKLGVNQRYESLTCEIYDSGARVPAATRIEALRECFW